MAKTNNRRIEPVGITPLGGPATSSTSNSRVITPKAARQISESLKERILSGEFPPGSYLPAAGELLEEFEVSRPTLREALNTLETDGLVRLRRGPNGGAIVQSPDNAAIIRQLGFLLRYDGTTIEQLMDVRLLVDPLAARLVAEQGTEEDIGRLRQSLERQRDPKTIRNHEAWFKENLYFHWAIAAGSGNPVVRVLSESLHNITLDGGLKIRVKQSERLTSIEEHEAVYTAIAEGDGDKSAEMIRQHLQRSIYLRAHYTR
ncbi:MAG TPA: FadR/GntR family transcriptional regulator [Acidimicrobiales bacterium]|jgi:DNA-binding FadR family transcriptional regulator